MHTEDVFLLGVLERERERDSEWVDIKARENKKEKRGRRKE